jgi:hypothetical protein
MEVASGILSAPGLVVDNVVFCSRFMMLSTSDHELKMLRRWVNATSSSYFVDLQARVSVKLP